MRHATTIILFILLVAGLHACSTASKANYAASMGDYEEASELYTQALQDDPDNFFLLRKRAEWDYKFGEYDKALPVLERLNVRNPFDPDVQYYLAITRIAKGNTAEGLDTLINFRTQFKHVLRREISWAAEWLATSDMSKEDLFKALEHAWKNALYEQRQDDYRRFDDN